MDRLASESPDSFIVIGNVKQPGRSVPGRPVYWFEIWLYSVNIFFYFPMNMPFKLSYNSKEGKLCIHENKYQKVASYFLQLCSMYTIVCTMKDVVEYVQTSDNNLRYFDLGFYIAAFTHALYCRYLVLVGTTKLKKMVDALNETHLLKYASTRSKPNVILLFVYLFAQSIPVVFCVYCTMFGIDQWSLPVVSESLKNQAIAFLKLEEDQLSEYPIASILMMAFVGYLNLFELANWAMGDMFAIAGIYFLYTVSKDAFQYLTSVTDSGIERLHLIREGMQIVTAYVKLVGAVNDGVGLIFCTYSLYCNSYYGVHLVELLNNPDLRNRYVVVTQIASLIFTLINAAKHCVHYRAIRRWLRKSDACMRVSPQQHSVLLHNLNSDTYAAGSFFKITPAVVGSLTGQVATFATVVVTMK